MARLQDLVDTPDTVLALEPEELALLILDELIEIERHGTEPHRKNFILRFRNFEQIHEALMEAWAWLESSGCLVQSPLKDEGWRFITRRGRELAKSSNTAVFTREQTLPRHLLHPLIEQKVWSAFLRGAYDSAVFEAFKQVEVAIRSASASADSEIGVALARKAFGVGNGPLTDTTTVNSEQQALSDLFAGALGSYKNPHSHRNVTIKDASEAAEMIILASHLLKIVDARRSNEPD